MLNYEIGSIWRKWDLHVHTPFSILNNQFGNDFKKYIHELFKKAIDNNIAAIGITDYFSIEGYEEIEKYKSNEQEMKEIFKSELEQDDRYLQRINNIAIFPNIELRLDTCVICGDKQKKLQIHVILDNKISINKIKENFLNLITISSNITVNGMNEHGLTKGNIIELGKKVIEENPDGFSNMTEYQAGCNVVAVNFDKIKDILEKNFKNQYLLLAVEDDITKINWKDQGHMIRKKIYSACHGIMSSNDNTIKWGLEKETQKEFSSLKPCFWGSDAHNYDKMFKPDLDKFCWIKADKTFEGLRQTLINPADRIYIGSSCIENDNVSKNKSNILFKINIKKEETAKNKVTWFNQEIQINPYMTTIIGNKGSGKSAIADIIALLCNSKNLSKASFLHQDRFKKLPENYAGDYSAKVMWADKTTINKKEKLSDEINESSVELAQFLPQRYIEDVCSGIGNQFKEEIERAIFSYMDQNQKENCSTLSDLIKKKTQANSTKFQILRNQIENINNDIYNLEEKKTTRYNLLISEALKNQEMSLEKHLNNKPEKVEKPKNNEENPNINILNNIDDFIKEKDEEISKLNIELTNINNKITSIVSFKTTFKYNLEEIEKINSNYKNLTEIIGINYKEYITFKINTKELDEKLEELIKLKSEISKKLSDVEIELNKVDIPEDIENNFDTLISHIKVKESLVEQVHIMQLVKDKVIQKTSIENQRYQKYIKDLNDWENKRKVITGEGEEINVGSIKYYKKEKEYLLNNLEKELIDLYTTRINIINQIYELHLKNCETLKSIYEPIESKLKKILDNMEEKISFDVQIVPNVKLKDMIISKIDQRVQGFFQGKTEGVSNLNRVLASTKFYEKESTISFVDTILKEVTRDIDMTKTLLKEQETEFYNYISSLNYLDCQYTLKLGNKDLKSLSPGERGIVLLIFYLALNKSDIPLIIDQPEDNLDNQSVYSKLVPCIKEAKKHRQIILVTHNPNIAIASDSEQIIFCTIDKKTNEIHYKSGSIENPEIRKHVIDVLEGTIPAFDLRRQKYC